MRYRILGVVAVACFAWIVATTGMGYLALRHVPSYYESALDRDLTQQRRDSDAMLSSVASLSNQIRTDGPFRTVMTEDQLNGWLAVDLEENHPGTLPGEIADPRIRLGKDGLQLACRYGMGWLSPILVAHVDVELIEANVLALRLKSVRAGRLPLPMARALDELATAAADWGLRLRWFESDQGPVARVELPAMENNGVTFRLEQIQVTDGQVLVAGHCERVDGSTPSEESRPRPQLADQSPAGENRQR